MPKKLKKGEFRVTTKEIQNTIGVDSGTISRVMMAFFAVLSYIPDGSVVEVQEIFSVHKINSNEFLLDVNAESMDDSRNLFRYLNDYDGVRVKV